jgi:hypothetical protein
MFHLKRHEPGEFLFIYKILIKYRIHYAKKIVKSQTLDFLSIQAKSHQKHEDPEERFR